MDTLYLILQLTIASAVPLAIVALGGLFSERSGVINIALEGIMIVSSFVGVIVISNLEEITFKDAYFEAPRTAEFILTYDYTLFDDTEAFTTIEADYETAKAELLSMTAAIEGYDWYNTLSPFSKNTLDNQLSIVFDLYNYEQILEYDEDVAESIDTELTPLIKSLSGDDTINVRSFITDLYSYEEAVVNHDIVFDRLLTKSEVIRDEEGAVVYSEEGFRMMKPSIFEVYTEEVDGPVNTDKKIIDTVIIDDSEEKDVFILTLNEEDEFYKGLRYEVRFKPFLASYEIKDYYITSDPIDQFPPLAVGMSIVAALGFVATLGYAIWKKFKMDFFILGGAVITLTSSIVLLTQLHLEWGLQSMAFVGLLIGGITGLIYAAFHAYASINMKANQVISGTALNMFALAFTVFFARQLFGVKKIDLINSYYIPEVPLLSKIPFVGDILFTDTYLSTLVVAVIFVLAIILLYKTPFGLRLRACGENPQAADSLGINVYKMRYWGVLISGFLAGIGGVIFSLSFSNNFDGTVAGFGFLALAVLIFAAWKPKRIIYIALFFGFMRVISTTHGSIPLIKELSLDTSIYNMVPYVATIIVLAFVSKNSQGPKASGEPYDPGKR